MQTLETWQITQLERLAKLKPKVTEQALSELWEARPDLFEQVTLGALDQGDVTVERSAELLGVTEEEVLERLGAFRKGTTIHDCAVVHDATNGKIARLADSQVAIWEIVREFRKLGSLEKLLEHYPSLTRGELETAVRYAQSHPEEIERQISQYETLLDKKRAEYPFVN